LPLIYKVKIAEVAVVILYFGVFLIVVGLVFGLRKNPKLARIGKSIECFAFLLLNLGIFYSNIYYTYDKYLREFFVVWNWLPFVINACIFAICLLFIWKPFNGRTLRTITLCIIGGAVVLIAVSTVLGTYYESFFEDLVKLVSWPVAWREHLTLIIIALLVFLCFVKIQIITQICLSVFSAIPFFLVWVIVTNPAPWDYRHNPAWDLPVRIACIGIFLIWLLFIWKPFGVKARRITALCLVCALVLTNGGLIGFRLYDESITFLSVPNEVETNNREISLVAYEPFREDTLAKSLDEPPLLRLSENLPRLDGATALYPLYSAFARAVYPEDEYRVYTDSAVACSRTAGAFEMLLDGKADIIFLMGVSDEQWEMARERGLELKLTPIGREAFVFFVNKRNTASNLTVGDIRDIYSGRLTNWREVGGRNDAIKPYQRAENSGSQTMLMEIMGDTPLMSLPESDYFNMMYEMYRAVAVYKNYKNSLGYSFRYYINEMLADNEIKFLSIDGIQPTIENIANGTYPLANDFYAITVVREPETKMEAKRMENAEKLVEWFLSAQGQSLVEKTGYVPLR